MALTNAVALSIHLQFKSLRNNVDNAIDRIFDLHPDEATQFQTELVQLCEHLLSSWLGPSTEQNQITLLSGTTCRDPCPLPSVTAAAIEEQLAGSCLKSHPRKCDGREIRHKSSSRMEEESISGQPASRPRDNQDGEEPSDSVSPPEEPSPCIKLDHILGFASDHQINDSLNTGQLSRLPSHTISPAATHNQIKDLVLPDQMSYWPLLLRLFYAIGSPEAFLQLRDACHFVRRTTGSTPACSSNEVATTIKALDDLDTTSFVTSVLRRYHLIRLVDHRNRLFDHHQSQHDPDPIRQFKYGHSRPKMSRPREGQKKSASAALRDLMVRAYPNLHDASNKPLHELSGQYVKCYASLKRRIGYGRNWHALTDEFGVGILCLVPVAGEFSIYNHQVEKMPSEAFQALLSLLSAHRRSFLRMSSQMLSCHIFDILLRQDLRLWYPLENFSDQIALNEGYDSFGLVIGCTNKAAEHPRGNEGGSDVMQGSRPDFS